KVGVEQCMAVLAQKHKKLPRLAGACGDCLLCRGQGNGRVPHHGLLQVVGHGACLYLSEHRSPLLSTLYEPLPKHLISVLDAVVGSFAGHERLDDPAQGFRTAHMVGNHHHGEAPSPCTDGVLCPAGSALLVRALFVNRDGLVCRRETRLCQATTRPVDATPPAVPPPPSTVQEPWSSAHASTITLTLRVQSLMFFHDLLPHGR